VPCKATGTLGLPPHPRPELYRALLLAMAEWVHDQAMSAMAVGGMMKGLGG
jgi:hypothetical protein